VLVNIANACDEWHWVKGLSPLVIAQMANNEQPHVLVDLNGFTDGARLEVGALKPAPVSVNYLGFPYTLTIPGFDYILSDRVVLPPEHHPECYTERVAWMPNTYMVNDHRQSQAPQIAGEFTLDNATNYSVPHRASQTVFANFNHLQKLGPGTFKLWVEILLQVPASILWLLKFPKEAEPHLQREFVGRGLNTSRLFLSEKFASDVHLNVKRGATMLLDTLDYNAHVSGLDALWAGLPLITLAGANMARRCGASFLRTSSVPELLARTPEEYVELAVSPRRSLHISSLPKTLHISFHRLKFRFTFHVLHACAARILCFTLYTSMACASHACTLNLVLHLYPTRGECRAGGGAPPLSIYLYIYIYCLLELNMLYRYLNSNIINYT